ncbi:hypothetical protein RRG08_027063 [Elysia crispata]|uniref:Uncharacterized protein n=1 Tax=Elysia crispata TaxID=231223 RepID=A0AAE0ZHG4_9GAST|nr:hypothetical protein RRG08_027063 [Elysia crispata]
MATFRLERALISRAVPLFVLPVVYEQAGQAVPGSEQPASRSSPPVQGLSVTIWKQEAGPDIVVPVWNAVRLQRWQTAGNAWVSSLRCSCRPDAAPSSSYWQQNASSQEPVSPFDRFQNSAPHTLQFENSFFLSEFFNLKLKKLSTTFQFT